MTLSIRALTAFMSTLTSPTEIPCEAVRALCAVFAIDSSVFEGTQPVHVQSPPMRAFSTSSTDFLKRAANLAAVRPAEPPPTTTRS